MTVSTPDKSPKTVGEQGELGSRASFTGERLILEVNMLLLEEFMEVKLEQRPSEPMNPLSSPEEGEAVTLALLYVDGIGKIELCFEEEEVEDERLLSMVVDRSRESWCLEGGKPPIMEEEDDESERPEGGYRTRSTEDDEEKLCLLSSDSRSSSCPAQGS